MKWNPKNYPTTAAVQFALAAKIKTDATDDEIAEYVGEAEHQDGDGYWEKFHTLAAAIKDFRLYLKITREG